MALFRGINVGRAKRISMADLRTLLEGLGYTEVRTLLNSGNAVFRDSAEEAEAAGRIERALAAQAGFQARVTVLRAAELDAAVAGNPLRAVAGDPSRLLVAFLRDREDLRRLQPLAAQDWRPDALALGEWAAYLWCAEGILASRLGEAVNRALKDGVTSRNWATVLKLQALAKALAEGQD